MVVMIDFLRNLKYGPGTPTDETFQNFKVFRFSNSNYFNREISLRINAIRETFEETGIFLCRTRQQLNASSGEAFDMIAYDREKWQKAVHNDPKEFLNMCRQFQVVPDLWSLFEWSAWASPAIIRKGYETAFFITFLNREPQVLCEATEVKECLVSFYNSQLNFI